MCDFAISSLAINFGLCCDKLFDLVPLIQVHRRIVGKISFVFVFPFPFVIDPWMSLLRLSVISFSPICIACF